MNVCFVSVQSLETWKQQQPQQRAGYISAVAWHVTEGLCKSARRIHLSHADTHIHTTTVNAAAMDYAFILPRS